jgi:nucleoside diphosphate kinase
MVTPYTVAKSRTGGVLSRLLSRVDLELVGAQMIAADKAFVEAYAQKLRRYNSGQELTLLADYVEQNLGPSEGRRHRTLLLLLRGENPCEKLVDICGHIISTPSGDIDGLQGEKIRDTYADLITEKDDLTKVRYFEPAVLTPRNQAEADEDLRFFAEFLKNQPNIIENLKYPDPSKIQKTLVIIKPDNWDHPSAKPGTIIDIFSRTGLRIVGVKIHRFSLSQALDFYGPVENVLVQKLGPIYGAKAWEILEKDLDFNLSSEARENVSHIVGAEYGRDQFRQIVKYMSGTRPEECQPDEFDNPGNVKCLILIYEGEDAIAKIRDALGSTDPTKAASGTVRREFGLNVMENTAHASDSPESFQRESGIVKVLENSMSKIIDAYLQ